MAQPPEINETFLREVDENLRRDQLRDFFKAYGSWLIAAVVLFLGASGGFIWWKQYQLQRSEQQVEKLAQIYKDVDNGNMAQAPQQLTQLSNSGSSAVSASAEFEQAAIALQQGDTKRALSTYKAIAGNDSLPEAYRDAGLIRETALEFDKLQPSEVISRLAPLTKPGEPWFGTAGEMTALAMLKQGKNQEAGELFAAISKDQGVPQPIRERAAQITGSLGVDTAAIQKQAQ